MQRGTEPTTANPDSEPGADNAMVARRVGAVLGACVLIGIVAVGTDLATSASGSGGGLEGPELEAGDWVAIGILALVAVGLLTWWAFRALYYLPRTSIAVGVAFFFLGPVGWLGGIVLVWRGVHMLEIDNRCRAMYGMSWRKLLALDKKGEKVERRAAQQAVPRASSRITWR